MMEVRVAETKESMLMVIGKQGQNSNLHTMADKDFGSWDQNR